MISHLQKRSFTVVKISDIMYTSINKAAVKPKITYYKARCFILRAIADLFWRKMGKGTPKYLNVTFPITDGWIHLAESDASGDALPAKHLRVVLTNLVHSKVLVYCVCIVMYSISVIGCIL